MYTFARPAFFSHREKIGGAGLSLGPHHNVMGGPN